MGICCNLGQHLTAESSLVQLLEGKAFKLHGMTYNDLLNAIVTNRVEQSIFKEHMKEHIIPEFYDENLAGENKIYYDAIFDALINNLSEKNNMYVVILFFYPFINHDKEDVKETFFSIFKFITVTLGFEDVKFWFKKYINFCTVDITQCLLKVSNDSDLINGYDKLITEKFTDSNVDLFVGEIMDILKRAGFKSSNALTKDMLAKVLEKIDLTSVESIRAHTMEII